MVFFGTESLGVGSAGSSLISLRVSGKVEVIAPFGIRAGEGGLGATRVACSS